MAIVDSFVLGTIAVMVTAKVVLLAAIAVIVVWDLSKRSYQGRHAGSPDQTRSR